MQRLKPGELVVLENGGKHYVLPPAGSIDLPAESGFVALIDFIEPRRANAVARIGKGLQTDSHLSFTRTKALIRQGVLARRSGTSTTGRSGSSQYPHRRKR
ncbi:MAG TPA: hypothetical protein VFZ84_13230 [Burkholderiales bacterium]